MSTSFLVKHGGTGRPAYHHGDLRNALIAVAVRLVAERGPGGLSLREAAREAGVTPSAVYRHFASKEALVAEVAREGHQQLLADARGRLQKLGDWRRSREGAVEAYLLNGEAYVDFAVTHPAHFKAMFAAGLDAEDLGGDIIPRGHEAYDVLVGILDALVATGCIDGAQRTNAEFATWSAMHGLASLLVEGPLQLATDTRAGATRYMCAVVLRGLGCAPELLPAAPPTIPVDPRVVSKQRRRRSAGRAT